MSRLVPSPFDFVFMSFEQVGTISSSVCPKSPLNSDTMTNLHVTLPDGTDVEATDDVSRVEAPVTVKEVLMCTLAAFGGIFFGYDSGYVNGLMGVPYFISLYTGLDPETTPATEFGLPAWEKSLIVAILSVGTL